jgi:AbiV family abortive infection protein
MKNKFEAVNLNKIDKMALITFKNALRLHFDSITLFHNKSYAHAYYLSVIALEELGKTFLLSDFIWNSTVNGRFNEYKDADLIKIYGQNLEEAYFKKIVYNHKRKQSHFVRYFDYDFKPSNKYLKKILDGDIENEKQNSLYVGLKRVRKKIDMKSRIINPLKFKKLKAEYQINLIQKCLLELTSIVRKGYGTTDSDCLDEYLTNKLYTNLKTKWSIKDKKFIRKLNKIHNNSF